MAASSKIRPWALNVKCGKEALDWRSAAAPSCSVRRGRWGPGGSILPPDSQVGLNLVVVAAKVKRKHALMGFKDHSQRQAGPALVEVLPQLADREAAVCVGLAESITHSVQGGHDRRMVSVRDPFSETPRRFNRATHSNCP